MESPARSASRTGTCIKSHKFSALLPPFNLSGGRYFFTREQSSLVAFAVGQNYQSGNGIIVIGTHTDSPCLKLKPISKITSGGICEIGVQTYGGGLWTSWFDRDLGVCGRAIIKVKDEASGLTTFQHRYTGVLLGYLFSVRLTWVQKLLVARSVAVCHDPNRLYYITTRIY